MLALCLAAAVAAPPKLVSIVWDGAADWVIDDMLERGDLPNVARLKAQGMWAESVIPAWPSKTAVGHASLFTGCWPDQHGVTNNSVGLLPRSEHTLAESRRGFDSRSLLAEPVWVTAVKQGRTVAALSAALSFPPDRYVEAIRQAGADARKFIEFSGFEKDWAPGRMVTFEPGKRTSEFDVAGRKFKVTLIDDPAVPTQGLDTALIESEGQEARLNALEPNMEARGWSPPFKVVKENSAANVYFRLWDLSADGTSVTLYQRKVSPLYGTQDAKETERYVDAYGGFHDDPFFPYERGAFGVPLFKGGDGTAERRCLELVAQDCQFLKRGFAYAWKRWRPDVTFHYTPMSDSAGHVWVGFLDDALPNHDRALAAKLWPFYRKVYQLQDDWLGFVLETVGSQTVVALLSDHGMAGAHSYAYVNTALEQAGLLVRNDRGQIDWTKTKAAVPTWSDFFVVVNSTDRKGGIVAPSDVDAVVDAAAEALLQFKDDSGKHLVTGVFRPRDSASLGLGGPAGGDLYFELAEGYYPSNRLNAKATSPYGEAGPGGVHGYFPYRRKMGAIFYASGGKLPKGRALPIIRHIDVFPTLFKAIGLRPAPGTQGVGYE